MDFTFIDKCYSNLLLQVVVALINIQHGSGIVHEMQYIGYIFMMKVVLRWLILGINLIIL